MSDHQDSQIWTDGGIIGRNPSPLGGTYAWLLAEGGEVVVESSGLVLPEHLRVEKITNNQTELMAALLALEHMGKGWRGTLYTDSKVTVSRVSGGLKFAGVPPEIRQRVMDIRRGRRYNVTLVAGHPTKRELAEGVRQRNGFLCSPYNVMVDEECQRLAREFLERRRGG